MYVYTSQIIVHFVRHQHAFSVNVHDLASITRKTHAVTFAYSLVISMCYVGIKLAKEEVGLSLQTRILQCLSEMAHHNER